jgi:hypothetical protein
LFLFLAPFFFFSPLSFIPIPSHSHPRPSSSFHRPFTHYSNMSNPKPNYSPLPTNPFADSTAQPTTNQSPASLGLGLIEKFRRERLSSLRPIAEFFDTSRMSKPTGMTRTRVAHYFVSLYHSEQTEQA